MSKKFTKLIPESQCSGGAEPDRDFYYFGITVGAYNTSTPTIRYNYRDKGVTDTYTFSTLAPVVNSQTYSYFRNIPKGKEVRLSITPTSTEAQRFKYLRSEKLGIDITSLTPNAENNTEWFDLNEDILDIKAVFELEMSSGGGAN